MNRLTWGWAAAALLSSGIVQAQPPSVLYTWEGTGNIQQWTKGFGANDVLLDNAIAGQLRIIEIGATEGAGVAIRNNLNNVRESSTASGGLDLTGLEFLEFDLGHNSTGNVNVQFFVQAAPTSNFVALGPDLAVGPGINTYQVPLSGLAPEEQVYVRGLGFNAREHLAEGNVTWTLQEVRSVGTPLTVRDLITHDVGTPEGGLQGAVLNFDLDAVVGNDGGQNQTGLSHNPSGSGSLQWTDRGDGGVGDPSGAAVSWGNGTAWNGNSFNERVTDLSNYDFVTFRISAEDPTGTGGAVDVQSFFQTGSGFTFQAAGIQSLPIDGQFHDLTFSLAGLVDMDVVDWTGLDLLSHENDIIVNVDRIRFTVIPEPASLALLMITAVSFAGVLHHRGRRA